MTGTVILEWTFNPKDFFEEDVEFYAAGNKVRITAGKVSTSISCDAYEKEIEIELHKIVEARFRAGLFLEHRSYKLSKPDKTVIHPDGRRIVYARAAVALARAAVGADIIIVDKDGRIIADSKRERIDDRNSMGTRISKHRSDALLKGMIDSYAAAVEDPDDELTHLYEIRDALAKRFGCAKAAQDTLGITSSGWSDFGGICNDLPLRQGRHRGRKLKELRSATSEELESARRFARSLIKGYVGYLEQQPTG